MPAFVRRPVAIGHPSETVGEGNRALLISSLDGEQFSPPGTRAVLAGLPAYSASTLPIGLRYPHGGWSAVRNVESSMDRAQKRETVAALKQTFNETSGVVVTRNLGLTVAQSTNLRNRMRDAGAAYKVTKNTLALIALEGTRYAPLSGLLTGPTAP